MLDDYLNPKKSRPPTPSLYAAAQMPAVTTDISELMSNSKLSTPGQSPGPAGSQDELTEV